MCHWPGHPSRSQRKIRPRVCQAPVLPSLLLGLLSRFPGRRGACPSGGLCCPRPPPAQQAWRPPADPGVLARVYWGSSEQGGALSPSMRQRERAEHGRPVWSRHRHHPSPSSQEESGEGSHLCSLGRGRGRKGSRLSGVVQANLCTRLPPHGLHRAAALGDHSSSSESALPEEED